MVKRDRGPTNPQVSSLIHQLRIAGSTNDAKIWKAISVKLTKPRRRRPEVNISKLRRYAKEGDVICVAGKILGSGEIDHPITVAAIGFSETAKTKIEAAKGRTLSISQLVEENPKGTGIRIFG